MRFRGRNPCNFKESVASGDVINKIFVRERKALMEKLNAEVKKDQPGDEKYLKKAGSKVIGQEEFKKKVQ